MIFPINNKGQVLIIATLILALVSVFVLILFEKSVHSTRISRTVNNETKALWLAEAGAEKAVWCLNQTSGTNCGGTYGDSYTGESNVNFDNGAFTTTVTGSGKNRDIVSAGTYQGVSKTIRAALIKTQKTTEVSYEYAAFSGDGGMNLSGIMINGNVYSNGSVQCSGATFSGNVAVAGATNRLKLCNVNGSARAHSLEGDTISGDAYYQSISGTTVGGAKYPGSPDPTPLPPPITNQVIDDWKSEAALGGVISGNYNVGSNISLGPKKITGSMTVEAGKTLTLTGTLYIQGGLNLNGGASIALDPSYAENSAVIVTDGEIKMNQGAYFVGTGLGGHVILLTTSDSQNAITASSGNGEAVMYAPNGEAKVAAGSDLIQVTAKKVNISAGSTITYDPHLSKVFYLNDISEEAWWNLVLGSRSEQN